MENIFTNRGTDSIILNIGPNIRRLRNLYDIKQEDLANRLGVSRQMLHHYESNRFIIPKRKLNIISDIFSINIEILHLPSIASKLNKE